MSDDGAPPAAVVVRRSRVDLADGQTALVGLSPELLARAGPLATDGVTVRGDLGGRELGTTFVGLGPGPAADRVRAVLLGQPLPGQPGPRMRWTRSSTTVSTSSGPEAPIEAVRRSSTRPSMA